MKKKINIGGIIVGLLFLGLAALFVKWSQTDSDRGVTQGILLFGGIGIFFIYQALKGKSTSSIFKTDVGGVVGVSPGTSAWTYLKWVFLAILLIAVASFIFVSFLFKPMDVNSWQNKIGCLINYNCLHIEDFEPTSFKPYTKQSQSYTYNNYWFYFTYPQNWKVDYIRSTDQKAKTAWDFRFTPLEGSASTPSSLSGVGTMHMNLYKPYYEVGIDGFINDVLPEFKGNVVAEGKKIGKTYIYYLNPKNASPSNNQPVFKSQYAAIGTYHTYLITFDDDTSKELEDKITNYLFQLIFFK